MNINHSGQKVVILGLAFGLSAVACDVDSTNEDLELLEADSDSEAIPLQEQTVESLASTVEMSGPPLSPCCFDNYDICTEGCDNNYDYCPSNPDTCDAGAHSFCLGQCGWNESACHRDPWTHCDGWGSGLPHI